MLTLGKPTRCPSQFPLARMALATCVVMGGIAALSMGGCASSAPRPVTKPITGSPLERLDRFTLDREALRELGYRVDWRSALPVGVNPRLAQVDAFDDVVLVQTADTLLSTLDASTGALRHTNELTDATAALAGNTRLGDLIVSTVDSDLFIIDPVSGDLLDRQTVEGVPAAEPLPVGSTLLVTTNAGVLLNHTTSSDGYSLWRFGTRNPMDAPPVLAGSTAIVVTRSGRVVGFEPSSGQMVGENSIFKGPTGSVPVTSDTAVYIASPDQSVYAFDAFDLSLLWRVRTAQPLEEQIALIDGVLYVPTRDRGLVALDANTGTELWNAPDVFGQVLTTRGDAVTVWGRGRAWSVSIADGSVVAAHDLQGVSRLVADKLAEGSLYAVSDANIVAKLTRR